MPLIELETGNGQKQIAIDIKLTFLVFLTLVGFFKIMLPTSNYLEELVYKSLKVKRICY